MNASSPFPASDTVRRTRSPRTLFAGQTNLRSMPMVTGSAFPERPTMGRARQVGAASISETWRMRFPTMRRSGRIATEMGTETMRPDTSQTSFQTTRPSGPMRTETGTEAIPMCALTSMERQRCSMCLDAPTPTETDTPTRDTTCARRCLEQRASTGRGAARTPIWTGMQILFQQVHGRRPPSTVVQTNTVRPREAISSVVKTGTVMVGPMLKTTSLTMDPTGPTATVMAWRMKRTCLPTIVSCRMKTMWLASSSSPAS